MNLVSRLLFLKPIKCNPLLCNQFTSNSSIVISNLYHITVRNGLRSRYLELFKKMPTRKKVKLNRQGMLFGMSFFVPTMASKTTKGLYTLADGQEQIKVIRPKVQQQQDANLVKKVAFVIYESFRVFLRALRLCVTFSSIFMLYPVTYLGPGPEDLWWKLVIKGIEFSGSICVKFGQWASTRRDLFSEVCCSHLSRLQKRTKPHSWHFTKLRLIKAFGKNWRKLFVKFDNNSEPVGSGCIAQVYKVWINEDAIEDKDILEEISIEMEDEEESTVLHLSDVLPGLEVLGFNKFFHSSKKIEKEQKEAIEDHRRSRALKREQTLLVPSSSTSEESSNAVEDVSLDLAHELVSPVDHSFNQEDQNISSSNRSDLSSNTNHQSNELNEEQHPLVEQWQQEPETLEKDLPIIPDEPEDTEGLVPVAVKVLHPGVYVAFRRDIAVFKYGAHVLSFLFPSLRWIALVKCVEEFSNLMTSQIDLRNEANNLENFSEYFANVNYIRFPRPVRPYVKRSVLVETFEEGEPIINFINNDKPESLKKNLAKYAVDMLLKMIFSDNFVHGDLHPGNILVQNVTEGEDGNEAKLMMVDVGYDIFVMDVQPDPKPLRLCILDCGIVSKLKEIDLKNLTGVFTQVVLGNGRSVADLFLENSIHECQNPELFRNDMESLIDSARENCVSLGQINVGILLQQLLSLLMQHKVKLEAAMSSVVLAVFVLEGLGRSLDPDMDILERARPLLVTGMR